MPARGLRSGRTVPSIDTGGDGATRSVGPAHAQVVGGTEEADASIPWTDHRMCRSYGPWIFGVPASIDVSVLTDLPDPPGNGHAQPGSGHHLHELTSARLPAATNSQQSMFNSQRTADIYEDQ